MACFLVVALAAGSTASAAVLSDTVEEAVTVVVTLEDQMLSPENAVGGKRQIGVAKVADLRRHAERTQGPIRQRLQELGAVGDVISFEPLWIFNGLIVTARPSAIAELASRPGIASVSFDRPIVLAQGPFGPPEPGVATIGAPALWNQGFTGQGVVIASLDTGVDVTHPDLVGRWRGGTNSWFDPYGDSPVIPIDPDGHGTEAISLAVGGDAGGSTIGVAPDAQFIAAKIFDSQGQSTLSNVHLALQWVLDPDGDQFTDDAADIVNNSWTFQTPGCDLEFELDLLALRATGILPVFAAGNTGPLSGSSTSPGNNPSALSVGSVDGADVIAATSARGPDSCAPPSTFPDMTAPGVNVRTAQAGGGYTTSNGTSFAAPHVSGAAALLLSASPSLPVNELETALIAGAVDLGPVGDDNDYGAGRLDVISSLAHLAAPELVFMSFTDNVDVPGVGVVADEDIVALDLGTGLYTLSLDGSALGIPATADIDGFAVRAGGNVLMSFMAPVTLPNVGPVDDSDIVEHDGASFSMFFDGSLVSLTTNNEDIDAFELLDDGTLLVSTTGTPVVGVGGARDEDVLSFTPTTAGDYTVGAWAMYLDSTDVGLAAGGEDVTGVYMDGPDLGMTTLGNFNVAGVSGTDEDIFSCNGVGTGPTSTCAGFSLTFDGTAVGLPSTADIDAIDRLGLAGPPPSPTVSIDDVTLPEGDAGVTPFVFTVSLDVAPSVPVMVTVQTNDATAIQPADYTAVPPTVLTFGIGVVSQTVTVNVNGDLDDEPNETFVVDLSNPLGVTVADPQGVGTILNDDAAPGDTVFMSFTDNVSVPGVGVVADEDVVALNLGTGTYTLSLDGSALLIPAGADIDGFAINAVGNPLMSFTAPVTLPGLGLLDDSDIVEHDGASFSMFFDGSLVSLTTNNEDIDAFELLGDGTLLVSTTGTPVVGVGGARDEDVLSFTPTIAGDYTVGAWAMYLDSTDVGLAAGGEDITGVYMDGADLGLNTLGAFNVTGASGADEDVFSCDGIVPGPASSCASFSLIVDGTTTGLPSAADIDAISRQS